MHNYKESVSYFFIYKFIKNVFKFFDIISFKSDWLKHAWKGGPSSQLLVHNNDCTCTLYDRRTTVKTKLIYP